MYINYNRIARAYCESRFFVLKSKVRNVRKKRDYVRKKGYNRAYMLLVRRDWRGGLCVA